jgi:hypothetical protein
VKEGERERERERESIHLGYILYILVIGELSFLTVQAEAGPTTESNSRSSNIFTVSLSKSFCAFSPVSDGF